MPAEKAHVVKEAHSKDSPDSKYGLETAQGNENIRGGSFGAVNRPSSEDQEPQPEAAAKQGASREMIAVPLGGEEQVVDLATNEHLEKFFACMKEALPPLYKQQVLPPKFTEHLWTTITQMFTSILRATQHVELTGDQMQEVMKDSIAQWRVSDGFVLTTEMVSRSVLAVKKREMKRLRKEEREAQERMNATVLRKEREAQQQQKLAAIQLEAEQARQREQEEWKRRRREAGLIEEVNDSVVIAHCTLRRGGNGQASCPMAEEDHAIKGQDKYVILTCTDGCRIFFHQPCWKESEKAFKESHANWRLKRGAECITEGCPGAVRYCAVQQSLLKKPQNVLVLVHPDERKAAVEIDKDFPKSRHQSRSIAKQKTKQHQETGETERSARPLRSELRHHRSEVHSETKPDSSKSARFIGEGQKQGSGHVSVAVASGVDGKSAEPLKDEGAPKVASVDVLKLNLEALKPLERAGDSIDLSVSSRVVSKKDRKVREGRPRNYGEQVAALSNVYTTYEPYLQESDEESMPDRDEFFAQLEQEKAHLHKKDATTATNAVSFPNLEEAKLATEHPEIFNYISNMEDILSSLRMKDPLASSHVLAIECIDVEYLVENGVVPEPHLSDLLSTFGTLVKFRLFNMMDLACLQFKTQSEATAALSALDRSTLGSRTLKVQHLQLYPSDVLLKRRLGEEVFEKHIALRTQQSPRPRPDQESKWFNAEAPEFRPSLAPPKLPSPQLPRAEKPVDPLEYPKALEKLKAAQVIGCDSNSLALYKAEGEAFGVLPWQLINAGFGSTPTALLMYQVDTMELHGIWRIAGRQASDHEQVVVVELVEDLPALSEQQFGHYLAYEQREGNEEGHSGYSYPQLVGEANTQALMHAFHESRLPSPSCTMARTHSGGVTEDEEDLQTKEALRLIKQAEEDELLARRMQEELNQLPQIAGLAVDEELALRLQAEENTVTTPSYSSAVRQDTYRIPGAVGIGTSHQTTPAQASPFSDLFPRESTFSDLFPQETLPWERESNSTRRENASASDLTGSLGPNSGDGDLGQRVSWVYNNEGAFSGAATNSGMEGRKLPAYRPRRGPAVVKPILMGPVTQADDKEEGDAAIHNDLLSSLLGPMPKSTRLPDSSTQSRSPNFAKVVQGTAMQRASSTNTASSLDSNERLSNSGSKNKSSKDTPACSLCDESPGNYLCRPCKHWGPCNRCVPSATDKCELYPLCLKCKQPIEYLIRVYYR